MVAPRRNRPLPGRGRPGLPGGGGSLGHRAVPARGRSGVRQTHLDSGLDHNTLDPSQQLRPRRGSRPELRRLRSRRRGPDRRPSPGGYGLQGPGADPGARDEGLRPPGLALRPALSICRTRGRPGPYRHRGRFRLHRKRHRNRPPGPGLWRGRCAYLPRAGHRLSAIGRAQRRDEPGMRPLRGCVYQGRG